MIGRIRGIIIEKKPPHILLEVSGIGYEIETPLTSFYSLPEAGKEVQLFTHLTIREDAHLLFGFATENERLLFRTLIRVNGVGAKMALAILSGIESSEFAQCIHSGDTERLIKLPGVGKKTAGRLIIEMRDRLKDWEIGSPGTNKASSTGPALKNDPSKEAVSALISLGYKPQEASRYVESVADGEMDSEAIIREALKASVSK